ncbi:metallophosphoesterase family protein [Chthonobacter rhizosphaerae]|uniref:metallophosphoesterase family protein n=1 Tax=Chthonobacter rhizosphaerae TaxID=2735553 RepID=UPI0015EEE915|nr:metallophosphoesterase family protein [Chthonobacter rhizosphaerae]
MRQRIDETAANLGVGGTDLSATGIIDIPPDALVYAVGDVHGCLRELLDLEAVILADAAGAPATVVYLGDYVDRGPLSSGVVNHLIQPSPPGITRICLRGNHEEYLLGFLSEPGANAGWLDVDGRLTLASYGVEVPRRVNGRVAQSVRAEALQMIPPEHVAFLSGLPFIARTEGYVFVHAGLRPGVDLSAQSKVDLLLFKDWHLARHVEAPFRIVHGHTVRFTPLIDERHICLDTGVWRTGRLTAARFRDGEVAFLDNTGRIAAANAGARPSLRVLAGGARPGMGGPSAGLAAGTAAVTPVSALAGGRSWPAAGAPGPGASPPSPVLPASVYDGAHAGPTFGVAAAASQPPPRQRHLAAAAAAALILGATGALWAADWSPFQTGASRTPPAAEAAAGDRFASARPSADAAPPELRPRIEPPPASADTPTGAVSMADVGLGALSPDRTTSSAPPRVPPLPDLDERVPLAAPPAATGDVRRAEPRPPRVILPHPARAPDPAPAADAPQPAPGMDARAPSLGTLRPTREPVDPAPGGTEVAAIAPDLAAPPRPVPRPAAPEPEAGFAPAAEPTGEEEAIHLPPTGEAEPAAAEGAGFAADGCASSADPAACLAAAGVELGTAAAVAGLAATGPLAPAPPRLQAFDHALGPCCDSDGAFEKKTETAKAAPARSAKKAKRAKRPRTNRVRRWQPPAVDFAVEKDRRVPVQPSRRRSSTLWFPVIGGGADTGREVAAATSGRSGPGRGGSSGGGSESSGGGSAPSGGGSAPSGGGGAPSGGGGGPSGGGATAGGNAGSPGGSGSGGSSPSGSGSTASPGGGSGPGGGLGSAVGGVGSAVGGLAGGLGDALGGGGRGRGKSDGKGGRGGDSKGGESKGGDSKGGGESKGGGGGDSKGGGGRGRD